MYAAGVIAVDVIGDLTDTSLDVFGWDEYVHSVEATTKVTKGSKVLMCLRVSSCPSWFRLSGCRTRE